MSGKTKSRELRQSLNRNEVCPVCERAMATTHWQYWIYLCKTCYNEVTNKVAEVHMKDGYSHRRGRKPDVREIEDADY